MLFCTRPYLHFGQKHTIKYSCKITKSQQITSFGKKNHGVRGNCRKSWLPWLSSFRDFLSSIRITNVVSQRLLRCWDERIEMCINWAWAGYSTRLLKYLQLMQCRAVSPQQLSFLLKPPISTKFLHLRDITMTSS